LPHGLVSAAPGEFAVVAEVPNPGTAPPDARANLAQPTDLLPGPDGGIIVVSESAPSIFTWITRSGELKPYIANPFPAYTGPSGAVSAYQDSPTSAIIITDTGQIARISANKATRLAQLPTKGNADILSSLNGSLLIQQENTTYRMSLNGNTSELHKVTTEGLPKGYSLAAISPNGSTHYATNQRRVISLDRKGGVRWSAKLEDDGYIMSVIADHTGGVWAGDNLGGLFHIRSNGKVTAASAPGGLARNCFADSDLPPIGEVYSMLLLKNQIYIADKRCDRVTSYGIQDF
jgi:hypothetical protein